MKPLPKILLFAEIFICFGPAVANLFFGLFILPLQLVFLVSGPSEAKLGALYAIFTIASGVCGLVALVNVVRFILDQNSKTINPNVALALMAFGILGILLTGPIEATVWGLYVIMPLAASLHIAVLGRNYLFGDRKSWR